MPSNRKADKPWDTPDIDKWKIQPFTPADNLGGTFAAESEFKILFPKYREVYLKEAWPLVTKALQKNGIACTLDLIDGRMSVKTTRKTYDPAAILKARDLVKLLARSVPAPQAIRVLEDGIASDIIKIRNLIRNKERFVKRRQRILGPNGSTLKAIELLTKTFILVHGGTVSVLGSHKSLKEVRRLIEDTIMRNIHPVYFIKRKMIMVELAKDPELVGESWDRFLPSFKPKTLSRRHVPHKVTDKTKKVYTPFPPPMEKSKIDLQIDTGEFFLGKEARERAKLEDRKDQQREAKRERELERAKHFVPGPERGGDEAPKKKRRRTEE